MVVSSVFCIFAVSHFRHTTKVYSKRQTITKTITVKS
nr:MAG TPA: hypothetical protein [Caudoviricetes sp.]DAP35651.1 MAG TPA: hypothetical protein [Caudoviricetes sp.]